MAFTLNLAGLTDAELHALLGDDRALAALPDVSRARLDGRPVPGPAVPRDMVFTAVAQAVPGGTPEQSRQLAAVHASLLDAGAAEVGGVWRQEPGPLLARPYAVGPDTAVLVRWNEEDAAAGVGVQVLTWLRDRASGSAAVLTGTRPAGLVPAPSEEVDVHVHPAVSAAEALALHAAHVLRHGRTRRAAPGGAWDDPWRELHGANLRAWERRGLLLAPRSAPGPHAI